jgi:site-specific recombinase XerD
MGSNTANTEIERELRRVLYETGVATSNAADLVPCTPSDALDAYLETNPEGNQASTMRSHQSRLRHFVRWCTDIAALENLNELQGQDLVAFKEYQTEAGYAPRTLESQLETLGVFLRFCRRQNYVRSELPFLVPDVTVPPEAETRDRLLEREQATMILDHLETFRYASREHVTWLLLAEKGLRICTLVALDLSDYHPPADDADGYLDIQHRPASGTRLKNGEKSERELALSPAICATLDDYIAYNRVETTDKNGREPLLSTATGRIAESTVRTYINKWTAPCERTGDCPHGRDPAECIAARQAGNMDCPSKRSPHDVRRGYITYLRRHGVPKEIISDEVDASVAVLDQHYDKTTKAEQRRMRAAALKAVLNASEE